MLPDLQLLLLRLSFLRRRSRAWVHDLIRRCQKKPSSVGDNFADKPKAEYRPVRSLMNTEIPDGEALSKVLKEWRTNASLPQGFEENVWRRIECSKPASAPSFRAIIGYWIGTLLPRPALALSYVLVIATVGAVAGLAQGRQESTRVKNQLGQRYLQVLNPYQAPRAL